MNGGFILQVLLGEQCNLVSDPFKAAVCHFYTYNNTGNGMSLGAGLPAYLNIRRR